VLPRDDCGARGSAIRGDGGAKSGSAGHDDASKRGNSP
jgi:hypothetical protein